MVSRMMYSMRTNLKVNVVYDLLVVQVGNPNETKQAITFGLHEVDLSFSTLIPTVTINMGL